VLIALAGHAAVDAVATLARKAKDTIEARVATGRRLDATLALYGYVHALSIVSAYRAARAGTPTGKDALLDRCAIEAVATGLDANRTDGTVAVRLADRLGRTRATKNARRARRRRSASARGSTRATIAANATHAAGATITTKGISGSVVSTTGCACCRNQQHSKPSISHEGLLINKFTEIFR